MAIKPNKKGVVQGTNGNDKITWLNTKDWKRTLTVNALNGNDIIDFRKSGYKNNRLNGGNGNDTIWGGKQTDIIKGDAGNDKLYGYNGNDTIYAGAGNDQLWGGNGNDILYGQAGTNKLYGEAGNDKIIGGTGADTVDGGAGNDIIYGGAGNDFLTGGAGNDIIYGEAGNDIINGGVGANKIYISKNGGTDQIFKGGGNDTLVFTDEKSAKNISFWYIGSDLVITNKSGNKVILKDFTNGHSVKTLQFQNYSIAIEKLLPKHTITPDAAGTVNGSASDDIINLNVAGTFTVNPGKGNDVINLNGSAGAQKAYINLNPGEGDIAINNLGTYTSASHGLYFNDNADALFRTFYDNQYIVGTRLGNSYEINLSSGQNVRIDNYFALDDAAKQRILYKDSDTNYYKSTERIVRTNNMITLDFNNLNFNGNLEYSCILGDDDLADHNITIQSGGNNTIVTQDTGNGSITIDGSTPLGKYNDVIIVGSGNKTIDDRGFLSNIYINNKDASATVYLNGRASTLHTYAGTNTITTKMDEYNTIYVHTADDATEKATATITSQGGDYISTWGNTTINFDNSSEVLDDQRSVNIMATDLTTTVQNIHNLNPAKLGGEQDVCFWYYEGLGVEDFEYERYYNEQYVNVYAKDAQGNRFDGVLRFDTTTGGGTFDSATTDDLIRLWDDGQEEFWLSSIRRYVDMDHVGNYYSFTSATNGAFQNIATPSTYLKGSGTIGDIYEEYELNTGKFVIEDKGSDEDTLYVRNLADVKDVKFFMDIKSDGTLASNDLYIFNQSNLDKYINKTGPTDYLVIKDYFGSGKIEDVRAEDSSDAYQLIDGALNNATNSLIQNVQAWLTNPNHRYDSVSAAIADTEVNKGNLLMAFNNAINNTTLGNYWQDMTP